ncbi:hypothetical protein N7520_006440 [Penicillium odoratum]|uniref:uncharacterized protein n=1 Tax=Penicillium odoratum TaxID=1167516 RepID=UPI002548E2D1|nr:uncharacterized protein N7520_006440 [Penicillium odoratum]KAJ5759284.1 hypothetical protein N7520_006440 [Penicillium odoratum]
MRALTYTRLTRLTKQTGHKDFACLRVRYVSSTRRDENFSVPIGNGFVSLRVTRPATTHEVSSGSKVILYLPPGPIFQGSERGEKVVRSQSDSDTRLKYYGDSEVALAGSVEISPQHALSSATLATVVTVNYRLGPAKGPPSIRDIGSEPHSEPRTDLTSEIYKYPTPIHDTLAGFDWIQNNLQPTHLGVFGSHVGGSLALMLALTEARSVHSVAAHEPICDWPGLDEHCTHEDSTNEVITKQKRSTRRKSAPPDLVPLLEARGQLFTSFERCFDSFASPILFLRSAGRDIPESFPRYLTGPEYPVPVLKNRGKNISDEQLGSSWDRDTYPDSDTDGDFDRPVRRRKALSRWPPYGLDYGLNNETWTGPTHGIDRLQVTLPWVRVFLGGSAVSRMAANRKETAPKPTVLAQQGEEMVSAMQKACFWGREKGFGERRVTLSKVDEFPGQELEKYFRDVFDRKISDDD